MSLTRQPAGRTGRIGVIVATAALAAVALPATAHADDATAEAAADGSAASVTGLIPENTVIGGPDLAAGSERLRDMGSGESVDAGLSAAQVVGSVGPLEAIGSAGGSAAASVASSGSLPGSTYVNATGSIGSGVIGLGSVSIPETAIGSVALQLTGAYFGALGERQDAGRLTPDELDFWHNVVVGSAEGADVLEGAADTVGVEIPGALVGSIAGVRRAAAEDPVEVQERIRAERAAEEAAEAAEAAEAVEAGETGAAGGTADDDDEAVATGAADDEAGETGAVGDEAGATGAAAAEPAADALAIAPVVGPVAVQASGPAAAAAPAVVPAAAPANVPAAPVLADTGADSKPLLGLAVLSVLLGGMLFAAAHRRA